MRNANLGAKSELTGWNVRCKRGQKGDNPKYDAFYLRYISVNGGLTHIQGCPETPWASGYEQKIATELNFAVGYIGK